MTKTNIMISLGLFLTLVAGGTWYWQQESKIAKGSGAANAPDAVRVLEIIPFELDSAMTHHWRSERPNYTRGALMVLEADGAMLAKIQGASPILCCGDETLNVLNDGWKSGRAIVVMPWFDGESALDLAGQPLYFGPAGVAEAMTKAQLQQLALEAEKGPALKVSAEMAKQSQRMTVELEDEVALYRRAATLVERFSPSEKDLISWLRGNE